MKYIVKHPNFDQYLYILPKALVINLSEDDTTIIQKVKTHEWEPDPQKATQFDNIGEARNRFTSPLCFIYSIEPASRGVILTRIPI
jgi:hypothetical protein